MLSLDENVRRATYKRLIELIEEYQNTVDELPIGPLDKPDEIEAWVRSFDFGKPIDPLVLIEQVAKQLGRNQVNISNASYYGLFNPASSTMGIVADALVAAYNPQLASWNHSPLAITIEQHLARNIGQKFGLPGEDVRGTFTSGGAEANHTAIACALNRTFPEFKQGGVRALAKQPVLYTSIEGHHSITKAARLCGLGDQAVRTVKTDRALRFSVKSLEAMIAADFKEGLAPFMVVGTAGTTSAGMVDPLNDIATVARQHRMWYHVDAAWGGASIFLPELSDIMKGSAQADSITFDCHKWLSVPMGAGLFLTKHPSVLDETFAVDSAYMPKDGASRGFVDPFASSMQWSRRFIGLKVFMSIAERGWSGYADVIRHQAKMGDLLRERLRGHDWKIVNLTVLPVVCFQDARTIDNTIESLDAIANHVVSTGKAWISTTSIGDGLPVLRACITNYKTGSADIDQLVERLEEARREVHAMNVTS